VRGDIGGVERQHRLDSAGVVRLEGLSHDLNVRRDTPTPLLGEALGGGAGLVDVPVVRLLLDQTIRPGRYDRGCSGDSCCSTLNSEMVGRKPG
jgi:hypothetical protein